MCVVFVGVEVCEFVVCSVCVLWLCVLCVWRWMCVFGVFVCVVSAWYVRVLFM